MSKDRGGGWLRDLGPSSSIIGNLLCANLHHHQGQLAEQLGTWGPDHLEHPNA